MRTNSTPHTDARASAVLYRPPSGARRWAWTLGDNMQVLIVVGAVLIAVANVVVSVLVARAAAYTKGQKIAQIVGIWLLPVVGAVAAWLFLRENDPGPPDNPHPDRDDLKTIGSDAPGSYGSPN